MPKFETRLVRFGVFEADLRAGELRRDGAKVKIQNQPFQILAMLLEHPGEIVTREEMRARLWPVETFVDFDHGIKSAIRRLRDALGDSAERPTFVETVERRGYRFIFPVQHQPVERTSSGSESGHLGMAVVVPISGSATEPEVPEPSPVRRSWKLRAAIALTASTILGSAVLLSNENSYLSRTRLGTLARRAIFGQPAKQRSVSQRRLTANPQDTPVTSAVISPDGKYLAFTDKTGFYLRQVSTGEIHPVPLPTGMQPLAESWFPDSDHLVVSWAPDSNASSSLWTISVLGGTPRRITEEGFSARVSLDGSRIAYQRITLGRNELWLMRADGTEAHRIVGDGRTEGEFFSPVAWAPDSKRVAYIRTTVTLYNAAERRATRKVEVGDLSTGKFGVVLSDPQLEAALGWVGNDSLLYSLQQPTPRQDDFSLWRIRLDLKTGRPLGNGVQVMSGRGSAAQLSIARDERLALRTREHQADVYVAELEAGGQRLTSPRRLTLDDRGDFVFTWMPDSKAVVFLSDRDGPIHIFKQAIDQPQPELLVGGDDSLALPKISPSGTDLLYLVMPKPGQDSENVRIMRMPLAGGPPQLVLEAPGIWNQECARPPSTLCIFSPGGMNQELFFSFDPITGASTELKSASRIDKDSDLPNWELSPDGKYLARSILKASQDAVIRILSIADGSDRTVKVRGWSQLIGIYWSADGESLWAGGFNPKQDGLGGSGSCPLLKIGLDGKVRVMASVSNVCFYVGIPSPDGRYLAIQGEKPDSSNVWLLENF